MDAAACDDLLQRLGLTMPPATSRLSVGRATPGRSESSPTCQYPRWRRQGPRCLGGTCSRPRAGPRSHNSTSPCAAARTHRRRARRIRAASRRLRRAALLISFHRHLSIVRTRPGRRRARPLVRPGLGAQRTSPRRGGRGRARPPGPAGRPPQSRQLGARHRPIAASGIQMAAAPTAVSAVPDVPVQQGSGTGKWYLIRLKFPDQGADIRLTLTIPQSTDHNESRPRPCFATLARFINPLRSCHD